MSGCIPLLPRPRSALGQNCPCCGKAAETPRLLGCLHSVCTPCLNKVENVLRMLEKKKGTHITRTPVLRPRGLDPLGRFLCPVCHTSHLISRLGVSVLPLSLSLPSPGEGGGEHSSMDTAARDAVREITERMEAIERDIARIRVTRESEVEDRRMLRREVVTYYEGYVNDVNRHKTKLEQKISMHHENTGNKLLKEEIHLEQCRMDLKFLCGQIGKLLSLQNNTEVVKLMGPVTKKLEKINAEILTTGEEIINKLQFVPKSVSHGDIPGFLSTFSVCQAKSHAVMDRAVYEKVLCSIGLHLADDNGLELDVYREIDIQAVMTLYDQQAKSCQMVNVSVENTDSGRSAGWTLVFTPPFAGIAHLSVAVDGKQLKNSPYVVQVRSLSLDDTFNKDWKVKKSVKFDQISL